MESLHGAEVFGYAAKLENRSHARLHPGGMVMKFPTQAESGRKVSCERSHAKSFGRIVTRVDNVQPHSIASK